MRVRVQHGVQRATAEGLARAAGVREARERVIVE